MECRPSEGLIGFCHFNALPFDLIILKPGEQVRTTQGGESICKPDSSGWLDSSFLLWYCWRVFVGRRAFASSRIDAQFLEPGLQVSMKLLYNFLKATHAKVAYTFYVGSRFFDNFSNRIDA